MASHINHDEYLIFHVLTNVKLTQINVKSLISKLGKINVQLV